MKKLLNKITNWEGWPFKILYTPISFFWGWYIFKSKSLWFFTASNPTLTFGGMVGEPKTEMYNLLPATLYPITFKVLPNENFLLIEQKLVQYKINYPLIVKPEVGGQGILLRKINSGEELKWYHANMPWEYLVQEFVQYAMEVSIFYIRHPEEKKGLVTGFLLKYPLHIAGDGEQTVEQLVRQHPKAKKRIDHLFTVHKERWQDVIPAGEKYMLSYAANHTRGAQFIDLKEHIDERLVNVFDTISNNINDFYYGRYDIMCQSVEDLKAGNNFTILEYNGCGAEPNHFYDTGYTLIGAYKEILKHWKALYEISKYNSKYRTKPWPLQKGIRFLTDSNKLYAAMREMDKKLGNHIQNGSP